MPMPGTLVLTRREVAALLTLDETIAAVEDAFRAQGEGGAPPAGILGFPAVDGGFHVKAAGLALRRSYFAVKTNGNFFRNRERFGMPNIQGTIVLCDGENGYPLAVLDSIEITILRTGAATAVAAKHLARPESSVATVCGCGNQGRVQLRSLARVLPLRRAYAYDADFAAAERLAAELGAELGIAIEPVRDPASAAGRSDVCVTCTPSRRAFLDREDIAPGTFLAAVGSDSADKQELAPALVAASKIVADALEQCAEIGELHHALESGLVSRGDVYAELGQLVAGKRPGRTS
ncbi:MAG TPA: ornithine cyclodeaminase family protein, partial [Thermoanaerobaculia bacterium]|nr:ornithine cyclodeaminase family protein [Thermoanaerobaculia bacterium]